MRQSYELYSSARELYSKQKSITNFRIHFSYPLECHCTAHLSLTVVLVDHVTLLTLNFYMYTQHHILPLLWLASSSIPYQPLYPKL